MFFCFFFFFQAEDGIRDFHVTGVQTCALPISIDHLERAVRMPQPQRRCHRHVPEAEGPAKPRPHARPAQHGLQVDRDGLLRRRQLPREVDPLHAGHVEDLRILRRQVLDGRYRTIREQCHAYTFAAPEPSSSPAGTTVKRIRAASARFLASSAACACAWRKSAASSASASRAAPSTTILAATRFGTSVLTPALPPSGVSWLTTTVWSPEIWPSVS